MKKSVILKHGRGNLLSKNKKLEKQVKYKKKSIYKTNEYFMDHIKINTVNDIKKYAFSNNNIINDNDDLNEVNSLSSENTIKA